jgi:hypothetical protein
MFYITLKGYQPCPKLTLEADFYLQVFVYLKGILNRSIVIGQERNKCYLLVLNLAIIPSLQRQQRMVFP